MPEQKMAERLRRLGLSEYEAKVYLGLVTIGKSGASAIAAQSGVPHAKVYGALEILVRKGLVAVALEKPRKWYAQPPGTVLAQLAEERKREIEELQAEIRQLSRRYERLPEEAILVMKGKQNFYRLVRMLKPQKSNYRLKWTFEAHPEWLRSDREARRRGVDIKTMGPLNESTKADLRKWIKIEPGIRAFPNEGAPIGIIDDEVAILGLVSSDATLVIRDRPFVKLLRDLYLAGWEKAKPISRKELAGV